MNSTLEWGFGKRVEKGCFEIIKGPIIEGEYQLG